MTVHQLRPRTAAETALIEIAESGDAGTASKAAVEALRREGLPHRRIEAWHYTDLRSLIGRQTGATEAPAGDATGGILAPLLAGSHVVDLDAPEAGHALNGLTVTRSSEAADWEATPNHLDRSLDTVRLLNAAFGAPAVDIAVDSGVALAAPIEVRARAGSSSHGFVRCTVGAGATATIVERLEGEGASAPSTGVSHLEIGAGARFTWIVDQEKGAAATHLGQLNVRVGEGALFTLFMLNAGGALVRYEVHAETAGEGAEIKIRGINLLEAGQHIDVTTTLRHTFESTTATETFRNIVTGGRGVFQGMIKVAREAQKTDAKMACNTLLLSDEGEFLAKPELEIFADDVQCGHGATAGEINPDHLFYLMSRGIPEKQARALLVKAFVAEVVEELEDEAVEDALMQRVDAWLARSH
ncbi:MAG TPA: Fe-S cluster assembly protein SufD [Aurantimonas sp.]|jgi:Fe-S cluster assembly protein SufD|nr:Fe-S cluster assembly protein SufD [Aurantimonas sp.]